MRPATPISSVASTNEALVELRQAQPHTYNFKLKSRACLQASPAARAQPRKDDITAQAIMHRADSIYISKWLGKQQPAYGQGRGGFVWGNKWPLI